MLSYYYDIKHNNKFETIFKETYIWNHKTAEANRYYILKFNFSSVNAEKARDSLNNYCNKILKSFVKKYQLEIDLSNEDFIDNLNSIQLEFSVLNKNIYIMIDEYDNFINKILISDRFEYDKFITDKEAIYKQFFAVLKAGAEQENSPFYKMFITGVSPMALYDVTSGYNIGTNITTSSLFNDAIGITKNELNLMLTYYKIKNKIDFDLINYWYNNYKFSTRVNHTIYNTDMILYYVNHFLSYGYAPDDLVDINIRSDYSKLRFLIYTNKKLNGNFNTLQTLIAKNRIPASKIVDSFSAATLTKQENFKSLLYYLGLTTLESNGLDLFLKIPNETIKRIICEYIRDALELENIFTINIEEFDLKFKEFARNGNLAVFHYLGKVVKSNTKIRDYIRCEDFLKGFLLAYFSLSNYFIAMSEKELNKGFADIFLKPLNPYVTYAGLLELKYITRGDFSKEKLEEKITEAETQLAQYEQDKIVTQLKATGKKVRSVVLVFSGWELVYIG